MEAVNGASRGRLSCCKRVAVRDWVKVQAKYVYSYRGRLLQDGLMVNWCSYCGVMLLDGQNGRPVSSRSDEDVSEIEL